MMAHTRTFRHHGEHAADRPTLITQAEAAEIIGCDVRSVYNWRLSGRLTTYRLPGGRAVRLSLDEVYALAAPEAVAR